MYSPRISEELIPKLYCIAKAKSIPMTKLVNNLLEEATRDIKIVKRIRLEKTEIPKEIYVIQRKEKR